MEIATEVATPEHVQKALDACIDYLWLGARTTANPIAVQELADAIVAHSHKPKAILVKNPVHNDPELWIGDLERLEAKGLSVIAVHRGCNHKPCWAMAHHLREKRPDIPLLIDPSHMSGNAQYISALLAKAAELQYDGSMIEVHPCPGNALSDSKQQITPDQYKQIVNGSISSQSRTNLEPITRDKAEQKDNSTLLWLRAEIDELDDQLWQTIADRMKVSQRIGEWKKANHIAPLQPQRYAQILAERLQWAEQNGLSQELIQHIFDAIHKESLKKQE